MNVTIGSALDLFGGSMKWEDVLTVCRENRKIRRNYHVIAPADLIFRL